MAGLLDRALRARRSVAKPAQTTGESDIPAEERQELLAEIEQVVAKARVPLATGRIPVQPHLSDLLLPILVNAGALVVICAAALITPMVLGGGGGGSTVGVGAGLAGEAVLVGTLRKESEQEVRQVQSSLQAALKQRDELAAGAETLVRRRQQELAASLNAELAAERERLGREGASNAAVERQLRALEQQKRAEAEQQLSDYQHQVDAQLARKDAQIAALRAQSSAGGEERERLAALEARTQGEQLVLDQLTASYARIGNAMKAGRWDDARTGLDGIASYLDQPGVTALGAVQKRKTVDLFLIDSLQRLVKSESAGQPAAASRTPATVSAAADAISAGNALYAAGNYRGSLERYGAALEALKEGAPGVEMVAGRIAEAGFRQGMADIAAGQDRTAKAAFDRAEALAGKGAWADAVASYAGLIQAYPQSAYVTRSTAGILTAVDALRKKAAEDSSLAQQASQGANAAQKQEELRAAAREKLRALRETLSGAAQKSSASADAAQEELIALLQVKVDVRQVLLSDAVRAEHPDLAAKLDRFLDLTAEVRRAEGRAAAMKDAAAVIDSLAGGKGTSDLSSLLRKYNDEQQRSSMQKLLDALRGILR